jgi:hypothetical protein
MEHKCGARIAKGNAEFPNPGLIAEIEASLGKSIMHDVTGQTAHRSYGEKYYPQLQMSELSKITVSEDVTYADLTCPCIDRPGLKAHLEDMAKEGNIDKIGKRKGGLLTLTTLILRNEMPVTLVRVTKDGFLYKMMQARTHEKVMCTEKPGVKLITPKYEGPGVRESAEPIPGQQD